MLTEILPVKLTNDELRERGERLAGLLEEIATEEAEKKAANDMAKDVIERLETKAYMLARVIRSRQEDREVQVDEVEDLEAKEFRTVRIDTGETVHRRRMTPEELQRPLPIEGIREKAGE